jgi:hypothetical protein
MMRATGPGSKAEMEAKMEGIGKQMRLDDSRLLR